MEAEKFGIVKRLQGDAKDILDFFDLIFEATKIPDSDEQILFQLRKIIRRCDYISSEIEKEFRNGEEAEGKL